MDKQLQDAIDKLGRANEALEKQNDKIETLEKEGRATAEALTEQRKLNEDLDKRMKEKDEADKKLQELRASEKEENAKIADSLRSEIEELAKKSINVNPGSGERTADQIEHARAYNSFLRRGNEAGLAELQQRALQTTADPDGGFAVPEEVDSMILEIERGINVMRDVSAQITVSTPDYKKLVNLGGAGSGWVGEAAARPETNTPTLGQLAAYMGEIYANPAATQTSLDDMSFNAEQWLASEVAIVFAEKENEAFTSGDGTNKPMGLFAAPRAAAGDATRPFGTLQETALAAANAVTGDELIDLIHQARRGYRSRGRFMMGNLTISAIRKLKDADGNYLWRPGLQEGVPSTLLGYGVDENEEMDDIVTGAAGAAVVAFGDFARAYLVVDRIGTRVLRDPYTNKPYVHFYTTKRVGGMPTDTNAVKVLSQA